MQRLLKQSVRGCCGKASGTINIELATLKRALTLAHEHGKLAKVPAIGVLKPYAPRSGFFEPE